MTIPAEPGYHLQRLLSVVYVGNMSGNTWLMLVYTLQAQFNNHVCL